jgi:hypothetical protein
MVASVRTPPLHRNAYAISAIDFLDTASTPKVLAARQVSFAADVDARLADHALPWTSHHFLKCNLVLLVKSDPMLALREMGFYEP